MVPSSMHQGAETPCKGFMDDAQKVEGKRKTKIQESRAGVKGFEEAQLLRGIPAFHLSSMAAAPCILFFDDVSGRTGTISLHLFHLHYEPLLFDMTSSYATPVCQFTATVRGIFRSRKCQQFR